MKESESEGRATTEGERRVEDAEGDQSPMAHSVVTLKRVNGQEPTLTHFHTSPSPASVPHTTQRSLLSSGLDHFSSSHTLVSAILHSLIVRADLYASKYK